MIVVQRFEQLVDTALYKWFYYYYLLLLCNARLLIVRYSIINRKRRILRLIVVKYHLLPLLSQMCASYDY